MPPKLLLASEVAAFTDTELDQYLEAGRLPNGDRMVEVEDPDNLPESFIQRLRVDTPSLPFNLKLFDVMLDGGRPFYPIELLPGLSRHPEQYEEILRYWREPSVHFWQIFSTQNRWVKREDGLVSEVDVKIAGKILNNAAAV
ncbi:uncharacterized protein B0H64DRAFT_374577 [Chaetomium fimeti]|uniref:Uncharacterized protein n=1 Tax=Chaetomium fimeti TaxID=1854472 RepID=A0AAE0HH55_9PEZI|nr:hypothetical protein B0H64DRAFT_374577 [Chaetomium fimeti]